MLFNDAALFNDSAADVHNFFLFEAIFVRKQRSWALKPHHPASYAYVYL